MYFGAKQRRHFVVSKLEVKPKMLLTVDKPLLSRQKYFYVH